MLRDRWVSMTALGLIAAWTLLETDYAQFNSGVTILVAAGAFALAGVSLLRRVPDAAVLAYCTVSSALLRMNVTNYSGSDVLLATREALGVALAHGNPYAHAYISTHPPGQPFPYLPGELFFYWLQQHAVGDLASDRYAGVGCVLAISALAPLCGYARTAVAVALYGVAATPVLVAIDGSNDTALTFLTIAAIVALAYATGERNAKHDLWWYAAGAFLFGWALAFKALAWIVFPFVARFVAAEWRARYVAVAIVTAGAFAAPYALASPATFAESILAGFTSHSNVWGFNVWAALGTLDPGFAAAPHEFILPIAAIGVAAVAYAMWRRKPRTLCDTLLSAAFVLATAFLLAPWTSKAYYTYLFGLVAVAIATYGFGESATE